MVTKDYNKYRGDDIVLKLTFTKDTGEPHDISGWTVFFTLKSNIDDSDDDAKIIKSFVIIDGASGVIQFDLTHEETDELLGAYYYDIQYKDTAGKIGTIQAGEFYFKEDVTRRTS